MATEIPRSEKHEAGRKRLPVELQPVFDELVEDYKFASFKYYGRRIVSYEIIADLILLGWRPLGAVRQGGEEVRLHPTLEPDRSP